MSEEVGETISQRVRVHPRESICRREQGRMSPLPRLGLRAASEYLHNEQAVKVNLQLVPQSLPRILA